MAEAAGRETVGETHPSALLTFLIADVRGYTAFTNEHGVPAAARLADRFAVLCREIVSGHEGEVIELRGDEALAVFYSPRSALLAAVALQGAFGDEMRADSTLPLRVGMGIDVGEVVPVQGGFRGKALNLAARLCSLAGPSEVFASEGVVTEAERIEGLAYVERGRVQLKGFPDPIRVIHILPQQDLPENFPALVSLIAKPSNLPLQTTPFIGRERDIDAIAQLILRRDLRLLTLTGTGGTGKTRLALQVGGVVLDHFERGVYFVNLAPLADAAVVAATIASTLKVTEVPGQDILSTLIAYLKDRKMLLVLDNFEHLLEAASVVHDLVVSCPQLTVLVTSRALLHLSAEHSYPVPPLGVPDPAHLPDLETLTQYDAVALFVDRARAVKPDFAVTADNAQAVAEICSRLDGLPLALELAASRITLFPPSALLGRLDQRLKLLTGGARDKPARQRTLRAAIDWSYTLLTSDEQTLFARLSVFAGGCTFEVAEEVCNPEGDLDLLEGIASLVEKSLLRQAGEEKPRFVMLETIRAYAVERLAERDEREEIHKAHAAYWLRAVEAIHAELYGPTRRERANGLGADLDNLRSALGWLLEERVEDELQLAAMLGPMWYLRGLWSEGRRWLETGLARGGEIDPALRARVLAALGDLADSQAELTTAQKALEEALTLAERVGDHRTLRFAAAVLGGVTLKRGDLEQTTRWYEVSLEASRRQGDTFGAAYALGNLGYVAVEGGDRARARTLLEEGLAQFRQLADSEGAAWVQGHLADLALTEGRLDEAEERMTESHRVALEMGNESLAALWLCGLGDIARQRQEEDLARARYEEALALAISPE